MIVGNGALAGLGDGATTSKLFYFPSDIAAAVQQTETEITSLAGDFDRAAGEDKIDSDSLAAFNDFYNEWRTFADDLSLWAKMAGSTVSQCQVFRERANQWRDVLSQAGARIVTLPLKDLPGQGGSPWASTLKWVAGAALAVAGVYALSRVLGLAKAVTPLRANPRRRQRFQSRLKTRSSSSAGRARQRSRRRRR